MNIQAIGSKGMLNKTLEQVLRDQSINFDSSVKRPLRLTYEKGKIKTLQLFWTFLEKGPITMTWSNLPSKVDFKSSLKIDKWSKRSGKKTFKASLSFQGKGNHNVIILMP